MAVILAAAVPMFAADASGLLSPDAALNRLIQGNRRYASHHPRHPDQSFKRQKELAAGQHPFAIVLGCSDSRVPPELVFDQGLGDLFVIRVAGETLDDEVIGSIEYAVEHLGAPLVVVLGHEKCGAVQAAVEGGQLHGHIHALIDPIKPAVAEAKRRGGDVLSAAIDINTESIVRQLRDSEPILKEAFQHGRLKVVGARYSLGTGVVTWLGEPLR